MSDKRALEAFYNEHPERRPSELVNKKRDQQARPFRYAVVQNFVMADGQGKTSISAQNVAMQVAQANRLYDQWNYKFILAPTQTIQSADYFNYNHLWMQDDHFKNTWNRDDAFNTYWFNNLCTETSGCYCGYAFYPWFYLSRTAFLNGHCLGNVFAHEVGHNLGLLHTHENPPAELVSEENCADSGDQVCDTAADPNIASK